MKNILIYISILSFLVSCQHDLEQPNKDVDILTPLFTTTLSFQNLAGDTILTSDTNSVLNFILEEDIYSFTLSDVIEPINLYINKSAKLDSLNLPPQVINYAVSLGEIAMQIGFEGILIIANNGNSILLDPIANIGPFSFPIDASQYFSSLSLQEGYMDITFTNNLPIDATNIIYELTNTSSGLILIQDIIPIVSAGSSITTTYDLSGFTIERDLTANVSQISSPGSYGDSVLIDTSNVIEFDVIIRDLILDEATAIFPEQDIINDTSNTIFEVENGIELTSFTIREGELNINIISTVEEKILFTYELPSVSNNTNYLLIDHEVDPAMPGEASYFNTSYDLSGYTMDLTGLNGNMVNQFYDIFIGRIDSSGNLIYLSLDDSITLETSITNLVAEKVEGFLGNDKIQAGPETVNINLNNSLYNGIIDINTIDVQLEIINKIGADAIIKFIELNASNSINNTNIDLSWDEFGKPIKITRAKEINDVITPTIITTTINENNSNIDEFIESIPNQLTYGIDIYMNPKGNISNYNDFIYHDNGLTSKLKLKMPLSLIAENIVLTDTVGIDFSSFNNESNINSATLTLIVNNNYPLLASMEIISLDEYNIALDTLLTNSIVQNGNINSMGIVTEASRSEIVFGIDNEKIDLLKQAVKLYVIASLSTPLTTQHIDIYDSYNLDLKLIADFNYSTTN